MYKGQIYFVACVDQRAKKRRRFVIGVKAFQFRLQAVLDLRTRQLEEIQQRFGVQQQRVVQAKSLLEQVQAQIQHMLNPTQEESAVDPAALQQRFFYIQHLKQQAAHVQSTIKKEEQVLNRIREALRQAHVKKRSLELLAEKQEAQYIKAIEVHEMNEMEDIVLGRMHHAKQVS